ncbi:asparagine synthase B [Dielma fastidiosa]|uniref:asparagine synthase B n=1 Tax=Dielma fastidiosa TaxID=1034346 RepID=UPI000D790838|nr:asparagine synthase B [Dielma fastidiosa]PWM64878.1 MAG: asparagine synthetase B [Dielma fastidiosa]
MCGLMFISNPSKIMEFMHGFKKIARRGPDMERVEIMDQGILGFHRLAIMGVEPSGMQPMHQLGNAVICNGEIYNFRAIKKELMETRVEFHSGSDCEILLPLYEKMGCQLFNILDAEFACVIVDASRKKIIAARDPLGIRPLFYGYLSDGSICFASEAKALTDCCDRVKPFPCGTYYEDGQFITYHDNCTQSQPGFDTLPSALEVIHDDLEKAVIKRLDADVELGILLSGGLDSSLVCAIAQKYLKKPIKTYAIGMAADAIDLKYAREAAAYIGSQHSEFLMSREDVLSALDEVIMTLETYDITTIRASLGMYLLCRQIHAKTNIKVLLSGEVSDELFGYKYTDYAPDAQAFQEESEKRIRELYMYDVLRADRCISAHALEARVPFGDLRFLSDVLAIDPKLKMNRYGKGKYLLRKAFEKDKLLPDSILMREKAAFSDAVGHSMVDELKAYAQTLYSDEEFTKRCQLYAYHAIPYTKESLMYREIFEKYYPGRAAWIKDYWLPNQSWKGCHVSDPSARVLDNYGESGK